ncbi:MAG: dihydrodipicolinate synthase family protein [archaeon]|nr:dihydrodipicolinate synthase family protein [archaeon]
MEPEKLCEYLMKGAVVVVQITPFKDKEELDIEGLRENTAFLVEKRHLGPLMLLPTGSTGESYALNDEERKKVIKTVVDVANGKVPVMAGTHRAGAKWTAEHSKYAEDVGADGVMVILPYYHIPSEEGLYRHYKKIAESINIGMMVYNNADVSKIYIKPRLLKKMVEEIPNIVAVKENTPFIPTLYAQIKTVGDRVPVIQGRGEWWFAATAFLGVKGYVSGYANLAPEFCIDLLKAGMNGDYARLKDLIKKMDPLEEFVAEMNEKYGPTTSIMSYPYVDMYMIYGVIKAAMDILGLHGGHMRLPLLDISDEDKKKLEKIIFEKTVLAKTR